MADCTRECTKLRKRRERDCGYDRERKREQVFLLSDLFLHNQKTVRQSLKLVIVALRRLSISKQQPIISKEMHEVLYGTVCTVCTPSHMLNAYTLVRLIIATLL